MATRVSQHALGPSLTARRYQLDNGLAVILLPDHSAPVLSYQTWFRVGSRHERPGKTGLAHLFEHLMFSQSAHHPAGEFDRLIEEAGGDSNAATWVDWTYYRDNVPASALPLVVELEADRMQGLSLTDEQVKNEIEVVANERRFRVEDDVEGFLGEELFRLAFPTHPYGWPTIGWMSDILGFTPEDARAFYRAHYAPNNATIVVVGDLDPDATLRLIERSYAGFAPAGIPRAAAIVEPPQAEEHRQAHRKPVTADRIAMGWRMPAQGDPAWLPAKFLEELLAGGPSSRLHRRLVIETEVAASVRGMLMPFGDPGLLELSIAVKRGRRAAEALAVLDEELARLANEPIGKEELEKARNRVETGFYAELETAEGKAEALGHHEVTLGDYARLFATPERMGAVNAAAVQQAAARFLTASSRTIVVAEPLGDGAADDLDDDDPGDDGDEADASLPGDEP